MLSVLLGLFLIVMAAGAGLAILEVRGRKLPLKVSSAHGTLGVVAIILLCLQAAAHPGNYPLNAAIVISILTALGGLLLFAFRAGRERLPLAVVLLHGTFALVTFLLLLAGWARVSGR